MGDTSVDVESSLVFLLNVLLEHYHSAIKWRQQKYGILLYHVDRFSMLHQLTTRWITLPLFKGLWNADLTTFASILISYIYIYTWKFWLEVLTPYQRKCRLVVSYHSAGVKQRFEIVTSFYTRSAAPMPRQLLWRHKV